MKTSNPNIESEKKVKVDKVKKRQYRYLDTYKDLLTMQDIPVSELFLDRLGEDLLLWAKQETSLNLGDFFNAKHIYPTTYARWRKVHPFFDERVHLAKFMLGVRRERGAILKKYDSGIIRESMPMYDPEWKELKEWATKLAKLEQQQEDILLKLESYKVDDKGIETPL
jgi:hypothetical protein